MTLRKSQANYLLHYYYPMSLKFSAIPTQILTRIFVVTIPLFLILTILGGHGPKFISNNKCYTYLGCNIGFFGYDAFVHFVSSIMETAAVIWFMKKFPKYDLFHQNIRKNICVVVMVVLSLSFIWEFGELLHDQFRQRVFHMDLAVPNYLDQPTNSDTMGDISFSLLGSTSTAILLGLYVKRKSQLMPKKIVSPD